MGRLVPIAAAAAFGALLLGGTPAAQAASAPSVDKPSAETLSILAERGEYTQRRRHARRAYRGRRGNAAGAAIAAGVGAAIIGGAIAAQNRRRYDDDYYYGRGPGYGYYGPGYYRY